MKTKQKPCLRKTKTVKDITEYTLSANELKVLYIPKPGTGVVTTDIVYKVGSRDEGRGETGIAHMLEHMLFKPTKGDIKRKSDSGAMLFEREIGVVLNANTWKDRTSYYFSYPTKYFERAVKIEADRMKNVLFTDRQFKPEQGNVLSEHDMYAGDEMFSLSVQMHSAAFQSHPYGHETIGHRGDIQSYTIEKLKKFYEKFYVPSNATLIVAGDISESGMKDTVLKYFGAIPNSPKPSRISIIEPKQEGIRTTAIERKSSQQLLAFGIKHNAFPSKAWFETAISLELLAGDTDSLLYKELVDTGYATTISISLEPTYEDNLAELFINLTEKGSHEEIEIKVLKFLKNLTINDIKPFLNRTITKTILEEAVRNESSLGYVASLVEYVSAGVWEQFYDSEKIMKKITVKDIQMKVAQMFERTNLTVGYFKGKK